MSDFESSQPAGHLSGYAHRDWEVVDYKMYELEPTGLSFRGPPADGYGERPSIACIGAAQTFGCFTERPFPALLAEQLKMPTLNLGYGGAGPGFFVRHPEVLRRANEASLVVVQVMSGRSESNAVFESRGLELLRRRTDNLTLGADAAYRELLHQRALLNVKVGTRELHLHLHKPTELVAIIEETRRNWLESSKSLLQTITAPKVLLYISKRQSAYTPRYHSVYALLGDFPQLVDQAMLDELRPLADATVDCVTSRGSPQPLRSRFTGKPVMIDLSLDRSDLRGTWSHNIYYPSPEMHEDAANALAPVCLRILGIR